MSRTIDRLGVRSNVGVVSPCVYVSTGNITLFGEQNLNGVDLVSGERVLVAAQTDRATNGIYVVQSTGWIRAPDFNQSKEINPGAFIPVLMKDANPALSYLYQLITTEDIVIGTTAIEFKVFSPGKSIAKELYFNLLSPNAPGTTELDSGANTLVISPIGVNTLGGTLTSTTWTPDEDTDIFIETNMEIQWISGGAPTSMEYQLRYYGGASAFREVDGKTLFYSELRRGYPKGINGFTVTAGTPVSVELSVSDVDLFLSRGFGRIRVMSADLPSTVGYNLEVVANDASATTDFYLSLEDGAIIYIDSNGDRYVFAS